MNRLEMAKKLFENPKLKARGTSGGNFYDVYVKVGDEFKSIRYVGDNDILQMLHIENETWEIIEPKLKEFCFGELQYVIVNNNIDYSSCRSVVTGDNLCKLRKATTLEELKGKWTIEGYYED